MSASLEPSNPPPPDDARHGRAAMDILFGALFLTIGVVFLVIPSSPNRQTMMLLLGVVNIVVGIIKLARGLGSRSS
jgi:uncharacterized membrane protein HdeD (DUF308 family)